MATNFKHKDISQIFDMVRDRDHYTVIRDFFELSAISIRNNFDHGNEYANFEKRYMEIAQGYKKEYLEGFDTALGMLGKKIQDAVNGNAPFADWAGELYMDSGTSNGKAGQFFTPYSVSQCMARINFPKDEVLAKLGSDPNRVLTIYEPTCAGPTNSVSARCLTSRSRATRKRMKAWSLRLKFPQAPSCSASTAASAERTRQRLPIWTDTKSCTRNTTIPSNIASGRKSTSMIST